MPAKKALVTIAIGDAYIQPWKTFCYPGWKRYADKYGYDVVLITGLLDSSPLGTSRSPSWQRLLILSHPSIAKYSVVVWMDADIAINADEAPCIVDSSSAVANSEDTVGVVLDAASGEPNSALRAAINKRQAQLKQTLNQGRTWRDVYRLNGLTTDLSAGFNAGVMVLKPARHARVLQDVYEQYRETPYSWLEGVPLAYHLLSQGLIHGIPRAFNVDASQVFYEHYPFLLSATPLDSNLMGVVVRTMLENAYFLHFQGGGVVRHAMSHVPLPANIPPAWPHTSENHSKPAVSGDGPILVDAVFFQYFKTGIARVWASLLSRWAGTPFGARIVVLDRGGTAPKFPGLRYRQIAPHDYRATDADRAMLQQVCSEEKAAIFVSTYYTTPQSTPSIFMAYDMIPEVLGVDCENDLMWREKHHGLRHAQRFIAISQNTANDIRRFFPAVAPEQITVAHPGVDFRRCSDDEVQRFIRRHGITRPFFLISGSRSAYKNVARFFQAFGLLGDARNDFAIVCTGSSPKLEPDCASHVPGVEVHLLDLDDDSLQAAYSGAVALVYPSIYEGFGMPVIEAMACGCPVITTRGGALAEVAGDAAYYIDPHDSASVAGALKEIMHEPLRAELVQRGYKQAARFSWDRMAEQMAQAILTAIAAAREAPEPPR